MEEKKINGPIEDQNFATEDAGDTINSVTDSGFCINFKDPLIVKKVGIIKIELFKIKNKPLKLFTNSGDLKPPFHCGGGFNPKTTPIAIPKSIRTKTIKTKLYLIVLLAMYNLKRCLALR
jgi:hypothetical protein